MFLDFPIEPPLVFARRVKSRVAPCLAASPGPRGPSRWWQRRDRFRNCWTRPCRNAEKRAVPGRASG